jgi:hypothetical protein
MTAREGCLFYETPLIRLPKRTDSFHWILQEGMAIIGKENRKEKQNEINIIFRAGI